MLTLPPEESAEDTASFSLVLKMMAIWFYEASPQNILNNVNLYAKQFKCLLKYSLKTVFTSCFYYSSSSEAMRKYNIFTVSLPFTNYFYCVYLAGFLVQAFATDGKASFSQWFFFEIQFIMKIKWRVLEKNLAIFSDIF